MVVTNGTKEHVLFSPENMNANWSHTLQMYGVPNACNTSSRKLIHILPVSHLGQTSTGLYPYRQARRNCLSDTITFYLLHWCKDKLSLSASTTRNSEKHIFPTTFSFISAGFREYPPLLIAHINLDTELIINITKSDKKNANVSVQPITLVVWCKAIGLRPLDN